MKYTETQKFRQKHSKMYKHNRKNTPLIINVMIRDGYYIVESKINYPD